MLRRGGRKGGKCPLEVRGNLGRAWPKWMPGKARFGTGGGSGGGRIRSESNGAISSVEQRKSFRWGVGSGMLRGRRMQLGDSNKIHKLTYSTLKDFSMTDP